MDFRIKTKEDAAAEQAAALHRTFNQVMREEVLQKQALPTEFNQKVEAFIADCKRKGMSSKAIKKKALKDLNIQINGTV